jgi:hypothetical protein
MRKPGFVRSMRSGFNVLLAVLAVLRSSNVVAAAPVLVRCETTKGAVRMHVSGPHKPHARQAGCSAAHLHLCNRQQTLRRAQWCSVPAG